MLLMKGEQSQDKDREYINGCRAIKAIGAVRVFVVIRIPDVGVLLF